MRKIDRLFKSLFQIEFHLPVPPKPRVAEYSTQARDGDPDSRTSRYHGEMRIAVDARALQGPATGVGRYLEGLLGAWLDLAAGDSFVLLGCRALTLPASIASRVETRVTPVPLPGTLWLQTAAPAAAARAGAELFFGPLGVAPLAARIPVVLTVHDLTPILFPQWHHARNRLGFEPFLAASVRKAKRIAAVSESTRRDLVARVPQAEGKCSVVPNGFVSPGVVSPFRAERSYVLFLGTLEPRKNVERLVSAMERLWDAEPGFPDLVLAGGDGWGLPRFAERLRASRHAARIRRLGYVDAPTAASLVSGARLLAYPSLYEGFGLPPLEAMALGTPVVASSSSSLPEVVGDAGLLPDPESVEAIAAAILRAERDEKWRTEARARGLVRAARFTWTAAARAMRELCGEALAA